MTQTFRTIAIPKEWAVPEILACSDLLFLEDIGHRLYIDPTVIITKAKEKTENITVLWEVFGLKKLWNRWVVYMPRFCPFYDENFKEVASMKALGRPIKYGDLLNKLDGDQLFTPASIARFGVEVDYYEGLSDEERTVLMKRIRLALGRLAKSRNFPPDGDGSIQLKGQALTPAWYGWRWKNAVNCVLPGEGGQQ